MILIRVDGQMKYLKIYFIRKKKQIGAGIPAYLYYEAANKLIVRFITRTFFSDFEKAVK